MKLVIALFATLAVVASLAAKEPAKKKGISRAGSPPLPAIIKIVPAEGSEMAPATGLIQSELSGRALTFFQEANRATREQLALAAVIKAKDSSEQLKAVGETIGSAQVTESQKIAELAAAKHFPLATGTAGTRADELKALSGAKFEKAWVEQLIASSERSVAAYEAVEKSDDADLRAFAEKMLPVAKARLQIANRVGGRSVSSAAAPPPADAPRPIPPPIPAPVPVDR